MEENVIIALQERLGQQDQQALKLIFDHFYPRLYRFAYAFVRSAEISEEIVEDVFIKLWQMETQILSIKKLPVYLYVSTKNRSLNYLKWKKKDLIDYIEDYPSDVEAASFKPDQLLMTGEMAKKIDLAINNLPPRCKLIFKLVKEDGLKYKEVAEILEISPNTVDAQMTNSLKKIAQSITLYTDNESVKSRLKPSSKKL